jgi:hypothetical protein
MTDRTIPKAAPHDAPKPQINAVKNIATLPKSSGISPAAKPQCFPRLRLWTPTSSGTEFLYLLPINHCTAFDRHNPRSSIT